VTLLLLTLIFPCYLLVKCSLFSSLLLFLKGVGVFESVEYLPYMDLTTLTGSHAVLRLGVMNFVGASENIIFMFSCLIQITE
jgi:hypothetical protein